jgi:hypothetical protein
MKVVEDVRRERLQLLREEFGTLAALNEKLGLNSRDSTLSQYLNQSTGTKSEKPKVMGSAMARRLEQACGKEVGWMDTDPELEAAAAAYEAIMTQAREGAHMPKIHTFGAKRPAGKNSSNTG